MNAIFISGVWITANEIKLHRISLDYHCKYSEGDFKFFKAP